jgi:hypothetical protein
MHSQWHVRKVPNTELYKFESSRVGGRFLGPQNGVADSALTSQDGNQAAELTIRKVPGKQVSGQVVYKCEVS